MGKRRSTLSGRAVFRHNSWSGRLKSGGNRKVETGDWLLGDDDGVTVLPKKIAVEYANRAMDVLEKENRIREEIKEGRTLAQVTDLLRWEKKV